MEEKKYLMGSAVYTQEAMFKASLAMLRVGMYEHRLTSFMSHMKVWEGFDECVCFDANTLMGALLEAGYPLQDMHHHASDLYVVRNELTTKVIDRWYAERQLSKDVQVSTFVDNITGNLSYDCSFQWHEIKDVSNADDFPRRFELLSHIHDQDGNHVSFKTFDDIEDAQTEMYASFQRISGVDPIEARLQGNTEGTVKDWSYNIEAYDCRLWKVADPSLWRIEDSSFWTITDLMPDEPKGDILFLAELEEVTKAD